MSSNALISWLESWLEAHADYRMHEHYGIRIESLDNPGWTVSIDLELTVLESKFFEEMERHVSDRDWVRCWVRDNKFRGVGDTGKLNVILETFKQWAEQSS
jgi:immunity protein 53 of polymorphic toxin system